MRSSHRGLLFLANRYVYADITVDLDIYWHICRIIVTKALYTRYYKKL